MSSMAFNSDLRVARRYHLKNFPIWGASRYTVDDDYFGYILGVASSKMEYKQANQCRRMDLRHIRNGGKIVGGVYAF